MIILNLKEIITLVKRHKLLDWIKKARPKQLKEAGVATSMSDKVGLSQGVL